MSEPQLFMRLPELSDLPPAPLHEPCYALRTAVSADHGQLGHQSPTELAHGHFQAGSMGPKIEAVSRFVTTTGHRAARDLRLDRV